jgi:hypothetical protein
MHSVQFTAPDEHNREAGHFHAPPPPPLPTYDVPTTEEPEPRYYNEYGGFVNNPPPYRKGCCDKQQDCCGRPQERCDEFDDCGPRTEKAICDDWKYLDKFWKTWGEQVKEEFTCTPRPKEECDAICLAATKSWLHVPYFPAFHRPGWLFRYLIGPFDQEWGEWILSDIVAGITIALTLIPQVRFMSILINLSKLKSNSFFIDHL